MIGPVLAGKAVVVTGAVNGTGRATGRAVSRQSFGKLCTGADTLVDDGDKTT
jgi:hypothetical protein